jgi:hypothetical protein
MQWPVCIGIEHPWDHICQGLSNQYAGSVGVSAILEETVDGVTPRTSWEEVNWERVVRWKSTNILEEHVTSVFRVKE